MKIKRLARRSKWEPQRFSILGMDGNTLSLILTYAREQIKAELAAGTNVATQSVKEQMLEIIDQIDQFINDDDAWQKDEVEFTD